jgi:hypothetical protein
MIFTTTKKKVEKEELFPDVAVMTLHKLSEEKGSKTVFELNRKAMEMLGFPMNTPNVSRIAHGYDESNNLVVATLDTKDIYTSNVTAKNTFSNQKLFERLNKQFNIDGFSVEFFMLELIDTDGSGNKYCMVHRINLVDVPEMDMEEYMDAVEAVEEVQEAVVVEQSNDTFVAETQPPIEAAVPSNQGVLLGVTGW